MKKRVFVEIEGVLANEVPTPRNWDSATVLYTGKNYNPDEDMIAIINALAKTFEVVLFSMQGEEDRLQVEDWVCVNGIESDIVLLRDEHDYSKKPETILNYIFETFDGNENKAFLNTVAIFTNHERSIEHLRSEGYTVLQKEFV